MKNWQNTDKRSVFFSLMKRAVTAVAFIMLMVVLILGIFPANRAEAATPGAASIEWPYYIGTGYEINTNHEVYRYSASGATRYHCAVKIISGAPDPANTNEAGTLLFDYPSTTETSQGIPISNNSSYCGLWVKLYARGISSTNDYGTAAIKYVQIKPLTPTLSNPTQANGTVSLSWSAASGAASYKVYRSESASTGFYEIASTTSRSYSETLPAGTYYYKVIAAAKTTSLVDVRILSNGIVGSFSETKSITIPQSAQVATPTPNPLPGTYTSAQNVILSCATSGATIRYTTNGNEPTSSSTQYISPITVSATTTIKAKAFKSGMTDSITGTFAYTINSTQVATPTASPSPGTYSSTQSITLSCATSGATIRYTTNNSEPTSSSTQYTNPISVSATTTIKAKAFRSGLTDSATGTFTYTIGSTQVATPTASPSPGSYNSAQSVTLSCTTSGATIRYTTNNSEPTGSSTQYTSPIAVSATTTIKAKAFRSGMTDSATGTFAYTINATRVGTPTASPLPGSYTGAQSIVLNCPTSGATIRYTTNNAEPTSSSTQYTGPIKVSAATTIKAKAFKSGLTESTTGTFAYTINASQQLAAPTASHASGSKIPGGNKVTLYGPSGATIRYTINGFEPNERSDVYSSPIMITAAKKETVIKAKSYKSGMTPSNTVTFKYEVGSPVESKITLGKVSLPIPNGIPIVGGKQFTLNWENLPVSAIYDDGKIMLAVGQGFAKGKNQFDAKEDYKKLKSLFTSGLASLSDKEIKNITKSVLNSSLGMKALLDPKITPSCEVVGYFEGALPQNGVPTILRGRLMIKVSVKATTEFQTYLIVPIAITVEVGGSAALYGEVNLQNMKNVIPDAAFLIVFPSLKLKAGVGIAHVASVGVYGGGGLNFNWNFTNNYKRLWLSGNAGLYAKALGLSAELELLKGSVHIKEWYGGNIPYSPEEYVPDYYCVIYDLNNYSISARNYLSEQSAWLGNFVPQTHNEGDIKVLQGSVYDETAPQMAEVDGNRVMVFLTDDGSRDDINRTKLVYSVYDENLDTWSLPEAINDDGTADFYPNLAGDGNNIWLTWHKSKIVFSNDSSIDELLAASEIAVARFDKVTGKFTDIAVLTDNNVLDTQPKIAVNGNNVFVTWIENTANDLFGINGKNNKIMVRQYTDGAWSTPVTLVGGLGAVTDMAAGYLGGNARVAYITDADNDLTTFVDRNLTVTDLTGTVTNSPASTKLVSNPSFSTINNESVLSWYETGMSWEEDEDGENYEYLEAGNIRYLTAGGQVKKLFDEADMMTDNYKIINDGAGNSAVIYPGQEDETGFIFAKLYNAGQWGKAFKLAKTGNFARFFDSVWQSSGEFYLAFNNSRIDIGGEDDDVLFREKNDLCVMKVAPAANIALADVLYSDEDVRLGEKLPISLDIENIGGIPINSVLIKTNDETVSTCGLAGGLLTGEQATLEFELDIPANMPKETDFTLSVEPSNAEDADPSDNSRTITLGHTNLILSLDKEYNDDNTVKVIANVENDSDYIANTKLLVYRGDLEGDLIETIEMGEITSRQSMSREFDFNPYRLIPKGEEYETLYFEIVSDKYELYSANKSDFVVIFANNAGGYGSNGEFLAPIDDPDLGAIKIYTAQDLDNVRNDLSGSYVLMNDLDLADFKGGQWAPIGSNTSTDRFTGTFDGQGYLIKNLTITGGANQYVGLFGYAGNATIKNVGLEGSNINISTTYGGGICGYIISDTVINNCYNAGPVSSGRYAGGICSYANSGTISNCYSTGEVLASSPSSYSWAGGICGFSSGSIVNCYNTGDITSYSSYAPISNAIIYSYAGGICAEIDGEDTVISDCHNTGNIYAYAFSSNEISPYAGGICGAGRYVLISNCYNAGIVSTPYGDGYAGGISGWLLDHSISNCYNSGDVFSANAGGIYGGAAIHAPNSVINCYNSGNVSAFHYAGGIYGKSSGNGSVSNCLVLSPRIDGELGSYPIGFPDPIEPTLKINNLALLGISGISIDDSNDRISLAEAKSQATYEDLGWDFENTWRMDPDYDYPQLKGVEFKRPPTGFNVSGRIKSYDPNNSTIICLRQDNEERYTITLNGTGGYSQIEQEFCFEGVDPGRYDLVITKDAHTKFTVQNLKVDNNDLDLSEDSRPEVKLMILRCGDINGDGLINDADLTLLWRAGNYNKKANEADNRACDLNGDGLINDADLTILWLAYNYNRGEIVIQPEIALSLNLSASNLNAQAAGDKFTVGVTSNTGWSVSSNVTWATAGKNSGSGNEEFTIKVDPNTFTSTRTALITVKADSGSSDKISYIIVNQAAFGPIDPSLDLSPKNISATDKGGAYSIDVTSNTGWTVSSNVTWAKTGISNGSGNDDLLITVDPNPAATTRTALITVKTTYGSGDKTDHIMINQDSAGVIIPDLDLSSGNVSAQGEGDTISIGVTSNTSWSVSANVTWTRIDSATGAQNGDITISVDPNNTSGTRTALITVKTTSGSDDVSRYLIITQPPAALGYPVAINSVFPALIF